MLNEKWAVAVDLGGSNLRAALVNAEGKILRKVKQAVGEPREVSAFFRRLIAVLQDVAGGIPRGAKLAGIGLGLPGICDPKEGIVHQLPHFPSWRNVPAAALLAESFSCPIFLDNDANMAAKGEHWRGAARGRRNFILLTLGTGIGGGIFFGGKLWQGESGFAGEVGHMVIEKNGRACPCGKKGCWEMYAASHAVPAGKKAEDLSRAASRLDPGAQKFWREFGNYLGLGIANLALITDIEYFILAGGLSGASQHYLEPALSAARKNVYPKLGERLIIRRSALQENSNILGCAASVFQLSSSHGASEQSHDLR